MKIKSLIIILAVIITASCTKNKALFEAKVIDKDGKNVLQYLPNMPFEIIEDSTYFYFTKEDYEKILAAEISKGKKIYKSEKIDLRVILRTYPSKDGNLHELVLRTFSKDFKTIDSYVIASTLNNVACNGSINNNLEISTTCEDGVITLATVDEYGKFIKQ
jgi:oligoribonuclease NrnB/cAMP/cGMP phosphodiesterase (DHH superfamily)